MERWVGTKDIVFCSAYSYTKSTKDVFNVHGAWQAPKMITTMVHGQVFPIII